MPRETASHGTQSPEKLGLTDSDLLEHAPVAVTVVGACHDWAAVVEGAGAGGPEGEAALSCRRHLQEGACRQGIHQGTALDGACAHMHTHTIALQLGTRSGGDHP